MKQDTLQYYNILKGEDGKEGVALIKRTGITLEHVCGDFEVSDDICSIKGDKLVLSKGYFAEEITSEDADSLMRLYDVYQKMQRRGFLEELRRLSGMDNRL